MQRRQFIATAGAGLVFAGCKPRNPAEVGLGSDGKRAIAEQKTAREQHLKMLEGFRVPPEASRTTPPRVVDLLKEFPDLRARVRVAIRLHPRYSEEPKRHESKLGGAILWPAEEPWPVDEATKLAYQPILQLRLEDAPAQVKFPKGKDLLQLLWLPREDATTKARIVWRKASEGEGAQAELPSTEYAQMNLVPVPCRLFPERVPELPEIALLPQGELKSKLEAWPSPDPTVGGAEYLRKYLNACPGTKAGGYVRREGQADPTCDTCRWPMDYLLTIGADDYGNDPKWAPLEEKDNPAKGYSNAAGLAFPGSAHRHVFLCRRCDSKPVKAVG
jgi:hypothetical protein